VFDYSEPDCGQKIRRYTHNKLFYVYDTIGAHSSPQICADALSTEKQPNGEKPQYCVITGAGMPRTDVERHHTYGSTALGETFQKRGTRFEANPQDFEHAKIFSEKAEKLLAERKFKPHRHETRSGGLDGILSGLEDVKNGKVSGVKLVYPICKI
jgi:hypothetical protein